VNKPSIVYVFYAIGGIIMATAAFVLLAALSTFATTVEGPPMAELLRDSACTIPGLLLIALGSVIELLHRIAVATERR